jgi:hypothetical protein
MTSCLLAADLPPDALKLVDSFEEQAAAMRLQADESADTLLRKVFADLLGLQETLTKSGKLDDAVAVRDRLKAAEATRDLNIKREILVDKIDALPMAAKTLIRAFDLELSSRQSKFNATIEDERKKLVKELTALQATYTKAGKLDEAVAIRDRIASDAPPKSDAKTETKLTPRKPSLPPIKLSSSNADQFYARYRQDIAAIDAQYSTTVQAKLTRLATKLKSSQVQQTKSGNLDQAVAIRDFLSTANDQKLLLYPKLEALTKSKANLAGDTRQLVDEFLNELTVPKQQLAAEKVKLNEQYAVAMEPLLIATLVSGDLEKSGVLLSQMSGYRPLSFVHYRDRVVLCAEAQVIVDRHVQAMEAPIKAVEEHETKERQMLIAQLKQARDAHLAAKRTEDSEAVKKVTDSLEADSSAGLLGALLVTRGVKMPANEAKLVSAFRDKVMSLKRQLAKDHKPQLEKLRMDLQPVYRAKAEARDFEAAFNVLNHTPGMRASLTSIPIKYAPVLGFPTRSGGTLIDMQQNYGLIRETSGSKREHWISADLMAIPGSEKDIQRPQPELFQGITNQQTSQPTGDQVTAKSELEEGQELLCEFAGTWRPVIVLIPGSKVRIQWVGSGGHSVEVVERPRLRFTKKPDSNDK